MSPVWKPNVDPPQLDKFCHLSHDAQRVMLALYSDYLQQKAEIMETKRVMSVGTGSRSYYQSIYEARFGPTSRDGTQSDCSNSSNSLHNPNPSSVSLATPMSAERRGTNSSSDFQFTARRLDFRTVAEGKACGAATRGQQTLPRRLPVSPDNSTYSDSPPVETQDFRLLSQFQKESLQDTLSTPSEPSVYSNQELEEACDTRTVEEQVETEENSITTDAFMQPYRGSESSEVQLKNQETIRDVYYQGMEEETSGQEMETDVSGSPNLFSQDIQRVESKTVCRKADRKRVQKHCAKLQKSYESSRKILGGNYARNKGSSLTKDKDDDYNSAKVTSENEIHVDFSKKLMVSPVYEMKEPEDGANRVHDRPSSNYSENNQFNFNPVLFVENQADSNQYFDLRGQSSITGPNMIETAPYIPRDKGYDQQLDHELCVEATSGCTLAVPEAAEKQTGGENSRNDHDEMAESPFVDKAHKLFPVFTKPASTTKQSISSLRGNDQAKRRPGSSQGFDAPFKKQRKMAPELSKQVSPSSVGLVHVKSLPSSELAVALSECLSSDEVAITLIYTDSSTQLRPNMFGQETKKRQLVKQKHGASSVCEVAVGTRSSAYNCVYIFPVLLTNYNRETFGMVRNFWKVLMAGPVKKVGFDNKILFKELMKMFENGDMKLSVEWTVVDVGLGVWLMDPDKPVTTFEQALHRLAAPQQAPCDSSIKALPGDMLLLSNMTEKLYQQLGRQQLLDVFLCVEMPLTPLLAAMEQREIHVATHTLLKFSEILKKKLQKLEQQAHKAAGHPFLLNSHAQLRQVLFETLRLDTKLPQKTKLAKTTVGRETSTSEVVLTQLSPHHPLPGIVLEYRQLQKLKSTYVDGILSCVTDGKLMTHWEQTAAATGRLSSYQPNVQAIPKAPVTITNYRDNFIAGKEDKNEIELYARDCFISRPGYSLLAADFQQIELRLLGHLTSDPVLIEIFNDPNIPDIFNALTALWLGKSAEAISTSEREQTKRVVYSVMYGVGKDKLAEYLKISPEGARGIMTSFLVKFPAVGRFTKSCVDFCNNHGYTQTIFKRRRLFPNIRHSSAALRAQAERQCVNFCIQGSAADLCKAAMLQLDQGLSQREKLDSRLLVQIHDELLFEVADEHLHTMTGLVTEVMESRDKLYGSLLTLSVPIPVSVSIGKTWGHMETVSNKGT